MRSPAAFPHDIRRFYISENPAIRNNRFGEIIRSSSIPHTEEGCHEISCGCRYSIIPENLEEVITGIGWLEDMGLLALETETDEASSANKLGGLA
jgi:hypothetical protein